MTSDECVDRDAVLSAFQHHPNLSMRHISRSAALGACPTTQSRRVRSSTASRSLWPLPHAMPHASWANQKNFRHRNQILTRVSLSCRHQAQHSEQHITQVNLNYQSCQPQLMCQRPSKPEQLELRHKGYLRFSFTPIRAYRHNKLHQSRRRARKQRSGWVDARADKATTSLSQP